MTIAKMIRILREELDRVDRCLAALELYAGPPRRGRPRKSAPGRRVSRRPAGRRVEEGGKGALAPQA